MAQIVQINLPQHNIHREIVGISTPSSVCLCCLDQNIPFVKLATCKHCSFFEALLKHKVRYREAVVCYQCHSFLKKIELFKNRAEESLRHLNEQAQTMRIPSDLDLSYSVPEITVIPNDISSENNYLSKEVTVKNETEVMASQTIIDPREIKVEYDEAHIASSSSFHNPHLNNIIPVDADKINAILFKIVPSVNTQLFTVQKAKDATEEKNVDKSKTRHYMSHNTCNNMHKEKPDKLINNNVSTEVLPASSSITYECKKKAKLPEYQSRQKQKSNPYANNIMCVTISEQQLLDERQENALKEGYLERPFKCETCIIGFQNDAAYKDHMEQKHTMIEGSSQCPICQTVIKYENFYQQHMKRHYTRYECGVCGQRDITLHTLLTHYKKKHQVTQSTYKCEDCDFITNTYSKYHYHKRKEHCKKIMCNVCSKVLSTNFALKLHILRKHEKNSSKHFSCSVCGKLYSSKDSLLVHMRSIHNANTITKDKTENSAYCAECDKQFHHKAGLEKHIKTHPKHRKAGNEFICHDCGVAYGVKIYLRRHIEWKHLNKTPPYKCNICSKAYRYKNDLRRHNNSVHENIERPKDKVCDICARAFHTLHILKAHMRTHTGERPFKCTECSATFGTSGTLYTHKKLKHKNKMGVKKETK